MTAPDPRRPTGRDRSLPPGPGRAAPPICSDLIYDRHNRELAEREARIRRLVDADIIGIFFWDDQDRILEANDAFLRMVGLDRKNLVSSGVRRTDLIPTDWYEHQPQLKARGSLQPFET